MNILGTLLKQPRRIKKTVRGKIEVFVVERQTWFLHRWVEDNIFDLESESFRPAVFDTHKEALAYTLPYGGPYQPLFLG